MLKFSIDIPPRLCVYTVIRRIKHMMKNELNPEEVKQEELEQTAGGKPGLFDGILMFGAWVACGFNHHYKYTGKTKTDIDGLFHVKFYQRICQDCQHEDWTRKAP